MKTVMIQFTPWDKVYYFDSNGIDLKKGDKVVVKTEMGMEIGDVVGFLDSSEKSGCQCPNKDKGGCPHKEFNEKMEIIFENKVVSVFSSRSIG